MLRAQKPETGNFYFFGLRVKGQAHLILIQHCFIALACMQLMAVLLKKIVFQTFIL